MNARPFDALVTFCFTPDLDATDRFYAGVLGLPLTLDQGSCRIYGVAPSAHLGFCSREHTARPDGIILTLVSDEVDAWAARLLAAGLALEKPPQRYARYDIYHLFVRDPNGYLVEIQRFDDPRWRA
jgi:catechol 2,3-dioxygenase-like lactoylglutathione lyase family enzyme